MGALFWISLACLFATALGLALTPKDVSWPVITLAAGATGLLFSILVMILGGLWGTIITVAGIIIGLIILSERHSASGLDS